MRHQLFFAFTILWVTVVTAIFDKENNPQDFDIRSLPINKEVLNTHGSCHECMHRVLVHIVSETEKAILAKCGHTDCEMVKHVCELARSDPAVLKGYLAGYTDATGKAYAYCYGEGSCSHPDASLKFKRNTDAMIDGEMCSYMPQELLYTVYDSKSAFDEISENDETIMDKIKSRIPGSGEITTSMEMFHPFDRQTNTSPFVPSPSSPFSPHPPKSASQYNDSFEVTEQEMDSELDKIINRHVYKDQCQKCAAVVMEKVMLKAIHWVVEFCRENQTNPMVARKCSMMQKIPNFSLGYLLSKVEPWKFSAGYCVGSRDCVTDSETTYYDDVSTTSFFADKKQHNKEGFFRNKVDDIRHRFNPYNHNEDKHRIRHKHDKEHRHGFLSKDIMEEKHKKNKKGNKGKHRVTFDNVKTQYGYDDNKMTENEYDDSSEEYDTQTENMSVKPIVVSPQAKAFPAMEIAIQ